jgi:site-specific recombinase XerD
MVARVTEALVISERGLLPAAIERAGKSAGKRFLEFFTAEIRNPNTRRAYARAAGEFFLWCEERGLRELGTIEPMHVAAWVETLLKIGQSKPTVKQKLAAVRMLFDWLVVGQVVPVNPGAVVRGPKHSTKKGKTPVLSADEARELLDSIDTKTLIGLRDRALIAVMAYTFARVGAVIGMKVQDCFTQSRRLWVRLHEKGGKHHEMPCHHNLEQYLSEYIEALGDADVKLPLFRTAAGRTGELTSSPMSQSDAYRMIRRRAAAAGIRTKIGNHTFRATGITTYLKNGGKLEVAQAMAAHESARTTGLYDRRGDDVSLDEIERIAI